MSCRDRAPSITSVRGIVARDAATLDRVPAERIAQNLAFINWTVLTALAVGAFGAVVLARTRTDATRGFLAFTTACTLVLGLLAFASDGALPPTLIDSPIDADPAWAGPRRLALVVFCAAAAA